VLRGRGPRGQLVARFLGDAHPLPARTSGRGGPSMAAPEPHPMGSGVPRVRKSVRARRETASVVCRSWSLGDAGRAADGSPPGPAPRRQPPARHRRIPEPGVLPVPTPHRAARWMRTPRPPCAPALPTLPRWPRRQGPRRVPRRRARSPQRRSCLEARACPAGYAPSGRTSMVSPPWQTGRGRDGGASP